MEHRDDLPGAPGPAGAGDDPGMVPADGPADGAVPVRAGHGRGAVGPGVAGIAAGRGRGLAGEGGPDLLRRADGRAAVVVAGMGVPASGGGRGRGKNLTVGTRDPPAAERCGEMRW